MLTPVVRNVLGNLIAEFEKIIDFLGKMTKSWVKVANWDKNLFLMPPPPRSCDTEGGRDKFLIK